MRKFIEIATPNFGSFLAANYSALIPNGTQAAEMVPGSSFLWSLATWNQRGDDLRGVDALAIIGNAGYWKSSIFASTQLNNASDGVVSFTSASLRLSPAIRPGPEYCPIAISARSRPHTRSSPAPARAELRMSMRRPETGKIILSFLAGRSDWQSVGFPNQTQFGGGYFMLENAAGTQYTPFSSVSLETVPFVSGWTNTIFYNEFVSGTGTFSATSTANQRTTCGPFTAAGGYFSIFRCKFNPVVSSVGPLLPNVAGWVVKSGSSVTISGVGFGQQCSSCKILAYPGAVALQVSSWSDSAITAFLPSTFNGIAEVIVQPTAGSDSLTFMASPAPLPPAISLSNAHLQFAYTMSGASPAAQTVTVANSGGGTLTWSATPSAAWITVSGASTLNVSVNPAGLTPGTYTGTISVTASEASNSSQIISVTLTVAAPVSQPILSLSPTQLQFAYTTGGTLPAPKTVTVSNTGVGRLLGPPLLALRG